MRRSRKQAHSTDTADSLEALSGLFWREALRQIEGKLDVPVAPRAKSLQRVRLEPPASAAVATEKASQAFSRGESRMRNMRRVARRE